MINLQVGSVPFLNARPLIEYLDLDVDLEMPSQLAISFRKGQFDLALVPIVECLLHGPYRVLDEVGVCSDGPVWSVLLLCRKQVDEITSISLDKTSLTSHYLTKIVCEQFLKLKPHYVNEGERADADLRIGDRALESYRNLPEQYLSKLDLGEIWKLYTGLPFVYAVWAIGKDSQLSQESLELFRQKSLSGTEKVRELDVDQLEHAYLTQAIRYKIGKEERLGVREFSARLKELGIPSPQAIEFI
ncbi:MAG: menaquinone biosynthesis protein [Verrucomicrobiota bacterium]